MELLGSSFLRPLLTSRYKKLYIISYIKNDEEKSTLTFDCLERRPLAERFLSEYNGR
jgi:hypothetical protein